jgi:predicted Zn-dependent peptidase
VFREFYKERDVVIEERRLRTESQPTGRLVERFINAAFTAHPYGNAPIGYRSDLERYTMSDSLAFFDKYYGPSNLVTAIVGGIKAKEIIPILDKYFGRIPARPKPERLRTIEPPQIAETVLTMKDPAQPLYVEGYHKPAATDPSEPAYDAIADVLTRGRTSRLYRLLVRDKQLAVQVQTGGAFPGAKYPHLFIVFAVPSRGVTTDAVVEALRPELERLKTEDITDEELARFKTRAKADLIRSLDSNEGLAENLANYHTLFGDWRELFRYVDRLEALTKADVRKAAAATFVEANRTVGKIETATAAAPASPSGAQR